MKGVVVQFVSADEGLVRSLAVFSIVLRREIVNRYMVPRNRISCLGRIVQFALSGRVTSVDGKNIAPFGTCVMYLNLLAYVSSIFPQESNFDAVVERLNASNLAYVIVAKAFIIAPGVSEQRKDQPMA